MPLTARSVSTDMPYLAATCGSVSFGFSRYACHDTSGWSVSSSLAAKISALSIGSRIDCSSAPAITGRLCCGLSARNSSSDSSASSAARFVSILRVVFTTVKNGASGMSASDEAVLLRVARRCSSPPAASAGSCASRPASRGSRSRSAGPSPCCARWPCATLPSPQLYAGERQLPVVEVVVQLRQVVERLVGRGEHVAPRVEPEVLLQAVVLAGRRHELPDARRRGHRHRDRVVRALDHRQQRDLRRHACAPSTSVTM